MKVRFACKCKSGHPVLIRDEKPRNFRTWTSIVLAGPVEFNRWGNPVCGACLADPKLVREAARFWWTQPIEQIEVTSAWRIVR